MVTVGLDSTVNMRRRETGKSWSCNVSLAQGKQCLDVCQYSKMFHKVRIDQTSLYIREKKAEHV